MTTIPGAARDVLVRADGVQLIGEMQGSGYREPPALVRRGDGQTIQLTPLLYLVLAGADGRRTADEVAAQVGSKIGRRVSADDVRTLVDTKLRPLGLLRRADGTEPELRRSDPLLGLRFRWAVTDPDRTRRLTAPFARLFSPLLVLPLVAAFGWVCWWVLFDKGLASATHQAFHRPGLLLLVFGVTVLSAGFHEFGHAAAARRGGATPGVMGMGVYLVWPAFYTDVTDSYRLGRGGRLRTDLGGLYFNALVAVAITGLWWFTGYDALLLVVATQILQMVRQLTPLVRFDGYHVLADLTGVPDLFHRIKPTLLGLLPWHWGDPETRVLKPWARAVVTLWVLIVVPLLLACLVLMVVALPRILGTAWAGIEEQQDLLASASQAGKPLEAGVRLLSILALGFPVLAIGYILARVLRQVAVGVWRRTDGRPARRMLAGVVAMATVAGVAWAWWPDGNTYRPIQPYERGTVLDAVSFARPPSAGLAEGRPGQLTTVWPADTTRPTRDEPQLALVLVPRDDPADGETAAASDSAPAPAWVFPFDRPLAPGDGDNQALAVNTQDGSVVYDVAFALVWVEDDTVLNTNEAYAFASCRDCAAVAVGFQVVLVLGQADVVVPQNLSAAVNYNCVDCVTYALAKQLVVTLDGPLSDVGMARLNALWREIGRFGRNIEGVPLSELQSRMEGYQDRILQIIERDRRRAPTERPAADPTPTTSPSATPTESASPTPTATAGPAGPTPSDISPSTDTTTAPQESSSSTGEPSTTTSPSPDASPTPSPSPSASSPSLSPLTSPTSPATPSPSPSG